eukprot:TRINITY_DN34735_c0_g1_i1.p1 TRINITY_DN34735_c0_g1~~TRINITY_DN34735_c0_g1_i1.p1  ORF type:complete len:114 (+),score=38.37 TRINITY_DN34735_c0_g1_i1:56-397(+)
MDPTEGMQQMSVEDHQKKQEQMQQQEEQRDATLRAILDSEARERLKRISCVKPEKARAIENYVIQSVRQGRMQPPISDNKLKSLLEAMQDQGGSTSSGPKITFARKARDDDDW